MIKRVNINKQSEKTMILIGLIAVTGFLHACATPIPPLPISRWGGNYYYNYEPPTTLPPASVRATIIVVNPFYKDAESILIDPVYSKVGKGLSKSMGVDLDKIIIAKGMTTIGPYLTLDDVTYPDKKNSDLTLAPRVFLNAQTKYDKWRVDVRAGRIERNFSMKIGGWVSYVMQEPLSGEKIWVKKLELEERDVSGLEVYQAVPVHKGNYVIDHKAGEMLYDGRADAIADALKTFYPTIMGKAWTYIDTAEILNLKEKTKEIRELKRY